MQFFYEAAIITGFICLGYTWIALIFHWIDSYEQRESSKRSH